MKSAKKETLANLRPGFPLDIRIGPQVFTFAHMSDTFVVKRIPKRDLFQKAREGIGVEQIFRQRDAGEAISHPFVVTCYKALHDELYAYFIFEFVQGGDVFDLVRREGRVDESRTRFIVGCLVAALGYLHSQGWIHRNVSDENVMIGADGYIKLGNFAHCKRLECGDRTWTMSFGHVFFCPPEVIKGKGYDHSVDWWALGILAYSCLVGHPPFDAAAHVIEISNQILEKEVRYPSFLSKPTTKLLSGLLDKDATKRLGSGITGADDVRQHPWLSSLDWHLLLARRIQSPFIVRVQDRMDTHYFDEIGGRDHQSPERITSREQEQFNDF